MWKCAANFAQSSAETFALTSHKAGRETTPGWRALPVVCDLQWLYSAQPDPQESASLSFPKHLHVLPSGKSASGQESLTHTAQQCPWCGAVLAGGWGADRLQNSQIQDTKHVDGSVLQILYWEYNDHKQEADPWPLSASRRQLKENLREERKRASDLFECTYFEIAARPLPTHGWITTQKEICWNPWKCNWADKESVCGFAHSNFLNVLEISRNQGGSGKISKGNKELNLISRKWIHLLWSRISSWTELNHNSISVLTIASLHSTSLSPWFCEVRRGWTSGSYFLLQKQSLIMPMRTEEPSVYWGPRSVVRKRQKFLLRPCLCNTSNNLYK